MDGMNEKLPEAISLRDWFAGMALQGVLTGIPGNEKELHANAAEDGVSDEQYLAGMAYDIADAMLAVRKEREK